VGEEWVGPRLRADEVWRMYRITQDCGCRHLGLT
jgi:hypothetical protein